MKTLHSRTAAAMAGAGFLALALNAAPDSAQPDGLLPKAEIGALRFLASHTNYDGRGVVIAVVDGGVDPGAAGLQTTPDGRPKIVDLIDASGDGDVDTTTVVEAKDGAIAGLSGRTLRPGKDWKNPTGKFHLGLKAGYDFFPLELIRRLKQENRDRWEQHARPLESQLRQQLGQWKTQHPSPGEREDGEQKELETRLEQLQDLDKSYEDPGPVFDCVVFHDGSAWQAVVDTDEDGDLGEEAILTNYRVCRRHATFGRQALLNFALNIYEDGNLLSIVAESADHGTHVAGIAARYLPDQPDLNGIAPGAQIVGIKYGWARTRGMESSAALARAIGAIRELHCDVVNASFGEHTIRPNQGRIIDLMSELVHEDGVVFVAAVGNNGPALSTVIAPGGTSSALIGIGAYHSPAMAERFDSRSAASPEAQYQFSSRGPTTDGALGVSVSAPGGALSSAPPWALSHHRRMAGTSMAAPSASGAVALLLSGLKAEKRTYSPSSIRRALENTARAIPDLDPFTQGHGLIQVDAAFALCQKLDEAGVTQPRLEVSVANLPSTASTRGIYLREPEQSRQPRMVAASVLTIFPKKTDNSRRVAFEARYGLKATVPWVQSAKFLLLNHRAGPNWGRDFNFTVDPTGLAPGVHFAEILAFQEGHEDLGPAFRVPITVIRPEEINPEAIEPWRTEVTLRRARVSERRFLAVPAAATWATFTAVSRNPRPPQLFSVTATQLLAGQLPSDGRDGHFFNLGQPRPESAYFSVTGGRTLELTVGHGFTELTNESRVGMELAFHGVRPGSQEVFLNGGAQVTRIEATAGIERIELAPSATLQIHRRTIPPSKFELRPLKPERDRLPDGRQLHDLILTYTFEVAQAGSIVPRFPALAGRLYDAEFESQHWMLHDEGKQMLAVGDTWEPASVRVQKGTHTLRLDLRHDRAAWLEKLETLPLVLDQDLPSAINLPVHANPDTALVGDAPHGTALLESGDTAALFLAAPAPDALPKAAKPGDLLLGRIRYESDPSPVTYPVTFLVPPAPPNPPAKSPPAIPDERTLPERLAEERRDLELAQLDKLSGGTNSPLFEARFDELQHRYPDHLPLLVAKLSHLEREERTTNNLWRVVVTAGEILPRIDTNSLRAHFGNRVPEDTPAARKTQQEMEKRRGQLIDVLHRKARALARLGRISRPDAPAAATGEKSPASEAAQGLDAEFKAALMELRRWVDTQADEYHEVRLHDLEIQERLGEALKLQRARIKDKPTDRELREQGIRLLERLGWDRWAAHEKQWLLRRFPTDYARF